MKRIKIPVQMTHKEAKPPLPDDNWEKWYTTPSFRERYGQTLIDIGLIFALAIIVFVAVAFILG